MTFDRYKKESRSFERLSINLLIYNKLLAQCTCDIHCDSPTLLDILIFFGAPTTRVCCLWRVMAAFVANVSELPFTHLHITCPILKEPSSWHVAVLNNPTAN
jgi:hypothetical protein